MLCAYTGIAQTGWQWGTGSIVFGSTGSDLETWPTVTDRDGNVFMSGIITGHSDSAAFGPYRIYNPGHYTQMVVVKADTSGNYLWAMGTQKTNVYPVAMTTDKWGNLYLLGKYENAECVIGADTLRDTFYSVMCFIVKIAPNGTVLWARNVAPQSNPGGVGADTSGNVYVCGSFFTAGINIGGNMLVNTSPAGGTSGYGGSADIYVAKFDTGGTILWAKSFGGDTTDQPKTMTVTSNGTIYMAGYFQSHTLQADTLTIANGGLNGKGKFLACYDANGNSVWLHSMNEHIEVNSMTTNRGGSIFMTGSIDTSVVDGSRFLYNQGRQDVYIAKYDAAGNPVWSRAAGGIKDDIGNSITTDMCGNLWVSGQMSCVNGITGYDMYLESFVLRELAGSYDPMFVAWYDTTGNFKDAFALPSGGDDESGIAVDNRGNFFLGGDLQAPMVFGSTLLLPTGHEIGFIARYHYDSVICPGQLTLATEDLSGNARHIIIYPNPAYEMCTIECATALAPGAKVELYDMTGRCAGVWPLAGKSTEIPLRQLNNGVYQCRIFTGTGITMLKLTVTK